MKRRDFLTAMAAATTTTLTSTVMGAQPTTPVDVANDTDWKFRFAAHIGLNAPDDIMFPTLAGPNPVDQIDFIADLGLSGIEDNFLQWRPVEVQARIGAALARRGLEMGCFVGTRVYDRPTFVSSDPDERKRQRQELLTTIEAAKRVNGRWITTLSSIKDDRLPWELQTANMIDNLKRLAEIAERADVVLLIEAINAIEYPGTFVTTVPHAYNIVKSVGSPNVRLMLDTYHAQIGGGDLIRSMDRYWDQISFIQIADNPGRVEPGVGEINYPNVLRHLKTKGYTGLVEFEHTRSLPGQSGEKAAIDAWRRLNAAI